MKLRLALATAALGLFASPALAATPPKVSADAYLVLNATTGEVLARHDAADRLPVASITKVMTVLVALERARPGETVTVSARAASVGGATAGLYPGQRLTVAELVRAALVASANDASTALAEHAGGSVERFVELMNERARSLGLRETRFVSPHGLDAPGHLSSARDVTRLARVAMRRALVRETVDDTSVTVGSRVLPGWNDLLQRDLSLRVLGVKTGHTNDAGWCQVAAARDRRGFSLYVTVLGSPTRSQRNDDLERLIEWGAARYAYRPVIRGGERYALARTQYGRPSVPLVAQQEWLALVNKADAFRQEIVAPRVVELPVRKGQRLGEVRVFDGKKLIARRALVAARGVERPGAASRAWWHTRNALDKVGGWLT